MLWLVTFTGNPPGTACNVGAQWWSTHLSSDNPWSQLVAQKGLRTATLLLFFPA